MGLFDFVKEAGEKLWDSLKGMRAIRVQKLRNTSRKPAYPARIKSASKWKTAKLW